MTYNEIFTKVKDYVASANPKGYKKQLAVEISIIGEGEGVFYIEAKDGRINVEPSAHPHRDVRFTASAENFLKLAKGKLKPVPAYLKGEIKVEGSIDKAWECKKLAEAIRG